MKQEITNKEIEERFATQPCSPEDAEKVEKILAAGRKMAKLINKNCPDSREKSIALTRIEEAVMWAIKSI